MDSIEEVYDMIADEFDKTRHTPWPQVIKFIDNITNDSFVLDIGCGNGKNMFYKKDISFVGIDISQNMVDLVNLKGGLCCKASMTEIPYFDNTFDNFICIASYHHLDNDYDRQKALNEMYRILKYGGSGLISVWAKEQPPSSKLIFKKKNSIVPWKSKDGTIYNRYYHIYNEGMLAREIVRLEPRFKITKIVYEKGNWYAHVFKDFI